MVSKKKEVYRKMNSKLIKYSTVGLLSLSLLLSHSVPTKAEMHNMASKGRQMDFTAVTNEQTHALEWAYGCSYCSYEPIMSVSLTVKEPRQAAEKKTLKAFLQRNTM